jgi:hypothetical protein
MSDEKTVVLADHRRKKVLAYLKEYTATLKSLKELEQIIYDQGGLFLFRQMLNRDPITRRPEKINPLTTDLDSNLVFMSVYRSEEDESNEEDT